MNEKDVKNKCGCGNQTEGDKTKPQSDVYSDTECHLEDSNVAIPSDDAVEEAKSWVDDENRR